jgi:CDP-4-dehydro-6-deoxyglucose reductase
MSNRWSTRVLEHDFLAADVRRLILEKPEQIPNFYAGQYLQLIVDDQRFPFSIASAPQTNQLELHIKPTEGSADSLMVEQYLNEKPASVDFTYPHGNCYVDGVPERAVILIAAATGVTQMRSIALWLLAQPEAPTVSLFWGTLTPEELYLSNELESLAASNHRFQYCPVVSQGSSAWRGRQGLVVNAAIEDCEDLSSADIYISGSPTMVYGTLDRLVEQGVDADRVSADVFDYAPRQ